MKKSKRIFSEKMSNPAAQRQPRKKENKMKTTQYLSSADSGLYAVRVCQDESGIECCERAPVCAGDENGLVVGMLFWASFFGIAW